SYSCRACATSAAAAASDTRRLLYPVAQHVPQEIAVRQVVVAVEDADQAARLVPAQRRVGYDAVDLHLPDVFPGLLGHHLLDCFEQSLDLRHVEVDGADGALEVVERLAGQVALLLDAPGQVERGVEGLAAALDGVQQS